MLETLDVLTPTLIETHRLAMLNRRQIARLARKNSLIEADR